MLGKQVSATTLVRVESLILVIRGVNVILDSDLAKIYGVSTARLNQQVKRNLDRFPEDFVFRLTRKESNDLMLQNATSNVAVEDGESCLMYSLSTAAIMAANVLKSERAVQMSVFVVRAFVRLREVALTHQELATKLKELEQKVGQHDTQIRSIIEAIRRLMAPPQKPKRQVGFRVEEPRARYSVKRRKSA